MRKCNDCGEFINDSKWQTHEHQCYLERLRRRRDSMTIETQSTMTTLDTSETSSSVGKYSHYFVLTSKKKNAFFYLILFRI